MTPMSQLPSEAHEAAADASRRTADGLDAAAQREVWPSWAMSAREKAQLYRQLADLHDEDAKRRRAVEQAERAREAL